MLQRRNQFWNYDAFGENFAFYLRGKIILATGVIKVMWILSTILGTLLCFSFVVDDEKIVPLESWKPDDKYLCFALYIMQSLAIIEILYLVGAVDAFYVLMCVEIEIQLKLVRKKIEFVRVGFKSGRWCLKELIVCTKHHNLLLRWVL